jgi:hypothetical protein
VFRLEEKRRVGKLEECRLLGYENPVRTSLETLYLRYRVQPVNAM